MVYEVSTPKVDGWVGPTHCHGPDGDGKRRTGDWRVSAFDQIEQKEDKHVH